jgi:NAD(P)-dependent dehydrogenase (short-subunit alcohol dehydrogenase family)
MAPSILIVGSTGNTGKEVVRTVSRLLSGSGTRIIAITRNLDSDVVRALSQCEAVEFEALDWTDIDAEWLKARNIFKAFIAPQNGFVHHHVGNVSTNFAGHPNLPMNPRFI